MFWIAPILVPTSSPRNSRRRLDWCTVILSHEMGHTIDDDSRDGWDESEVGGDNVRAIENPIREALELHRRNCYTGFPLLGPLLL